MNTTENKLTIETWLPVFPGFYGTDFDPSDIEDIDYVLWDAPSRVNEKYCIPICQESWSHIDYKKLHIDASKLAVDFINETFKDLGLDCECIFQTLYSPKAYNFGNDTINIEFRCTQESWDKIVQHIKNSEKFEDYIKEHYTSRSGFISFHSNDHKDWLKDAENITEAENRDHKTGELLNFYLYDIIGDTIYEDMRNYINEEMHKTGGIYDYINYTSLIEWINKEFNLNIQDLSELEEE